MENTTIARSDRNGEFVEFVEFVEFEWFVLGANTKPDTQR